MSTTPPPPRYDPPSRRTTQHSYSQSKGFREIHLETIGTSYSNGSKSPYTPYGDEPIFSSPEAARTNSSLRTYTSTNRVMPAQINPQKFRRSRTKLSADIINEMLVALMMFPFIVLAVEANLIDGKAKSSWGDKVKAATNFGPTFFPIFFSGVIGHALWNIANWKLEQGTTIGLLESLMGSRTIMSTAITLMVLRRISLVSLVLIFLWAVSPIGGQASLRLLRMEPVFVGQPVSLDYVNTYDSEPGMFSSFVGASMVSSSLSVTNTLFNAAFVANATSDQDPFGNPRLMRAPAREVQAGATTEVTDWISLIGIPIANIPDGNTTFTIRAGYIKVEIHDMVSGNVSTTLNQTCPDGNNAHFSWNVTDYSSADTTSMMMVIGSLPTDMGTTFSLSARTERAEFDVSCETTTSCKTISHRILDIGKQTSQLMGTTGRNLFANLACADGGVRVDMLTKFESYLMSGTPLVPVMSQVAAGSTINRERTIQALKAVDRDLLARRIETIFNTYYLAGYWESYGYAYTFPAENSSDPNNGNWTQKSTTKGTTGHLESRYKVSRVWVAVLVVSSLIPIAVSLYASTLKFKTSRIEVLGYVSALTRDNPYVDSPEGPSVNSTLGGLSRTRAMQDREICLGDIGDPGDHHGHIAVCDVKMRTAKISKKRSYIGLGQ